MFIKKEYRMYLFAVNETQQGPYHILNNIWDTIVNKIYNIQFKLSLEPKQREYM